MILQDGIEVDASIYNIILLLKEHIAMQGIKLLGAVKDSPDNVMISCPYHKNGQERRPSAGVKKSDGTFHCFACGEVHTLPELISHCFGENDGGALGYKWLMQNFVLISQEDRRDVELDLDWHKGDVRRSTFITAVGYSASSSNSVGEVHNGACFVNEEELEKYRYVHPYMYQRRLTDNVIDIFDIGYDKETECITFPVRDINGNCLFVARRSVKTKFFNYPAGAEKPLYGLYEYMEFYNRYAMPAGTNYVLVAGRGNGKTQFSNAVLSMTDKLNEIVVCESMLDALAFWAIGKFAVALNGLGNELQYQQLRELPCRTVILATDMDEAGRKAREKLRRELPNKIILEYNFPNGRKDANECTPEELSSLAPEL